ncbi:Fructosamine/Ketosamine-3-kinase [Penicillium macrosclerotiorum]|uniref:Fructosamine/Ketosamine-3-kinase n=1 Tax=Penicillium macrosclerotiorum TaxID=303699 RepID=UPI00254911DC|nr:Fructosamine/Ketosamine-3-kinase [Penicillium macrosclerotiorum]KAJ5669872.1 Fructosamine/Ketosamine-3-kinase [Penicillium macrosclerotiorum]
MSMAMEIEPGVSKTPSAGKAPEVKPVLDGNKEIKGDFPLDQIIIDHFPPGTQVHSCYRSGKSLWTVTAKIATTLSNGEPRLYFLKCADGDQGKVMLEGEFHSTVELYNISPDFVPEPYAWGKLGVSSPNTYYFLSEFLEMETQNQAPDPIQLVTQIAKLHHASRSPTGMFGFHINTCQGCLPQQTLWNASWVDFFTQLLRGAMALNKLRNRNWKDLEPLIDRVITHVVPQVLGPLEAEGRGVKPTLIHGDLWEGNIGIGLKDRMLHAFDAGAYYAHHEMEVAIWRSQFSGIFRAPVYLDSYLRQLGASEPVEQFDDRNRLYSAYMRLHASACHEGAGHHEE